MAKHAWLMFWIAYDTVSVLRAPEDKLHRTLQSYEAEHLKHLPRTETVKALKRVKAMQIVRFPVGCFANFSLKVTVVAWDEMLSQLLLFLTF